MGRYSYVLIGTEKAMQETFGSTCHGADRAMSRVKAKQAAAGRNIIHEMEAKGVKWPWNNSVGIIGLHRIEKATCALSKKLPRS